MLDRDERHAQGRDQFQHQRRQERDPQCRHRRTPVRGTQTRDPLSGPIGPPERAQRGDTGDQIQQARLQGGHRRQCRRRPLRGGQTDQHHEDRDQRQRDQHDERRLQIVERDHDDGGRGEDGRQEQRGQIPGEVGTQPVQAAGDHGRGLAAPGGQRRGWQRGHGAQHLSVQIGDHRAGPALTEAGLQPLGQSANCPQRQQDQQRCPPVRHAASGGIGDDAGDEVAQDDRRRDRASGDHHAAADGGAQVTAHRRTSPPQARVQRPRPAPAQGTRRSVRPIDGGIDSAKIRLRNTQ